MPNSYDPKIIAEGLRKLMGGPNFLIYRQLAQALGRSVDRAWVERAAELDLLIFKLERTQLASQIAKYTQHLTSHLEDVFTARSAPMPSTEDAVQSYFFDTAGMFRFLGITPA